MFLAAVPVIALGAFLAASPAQASAVRAIAPSHASESGYSSTAVLHAGAANAATLAGSASAQARPVPAVNADSIIKGEGLKPLSPTAVEQLLANGVAGRVSPNIGFNGIFDHITDDHSNQCLAVPGGSKNAGSRLIQWPCGSNADHYWSAYYQFTDAAGIYWFHVVNYNSHQCLAVPGASTTANVQVIQWPCGNYPDHYWAFASDSAGRISIWNYNSAQVLSVRGASQSAGAAVIQYPYGPYVDQAWH
jgi:hypothetical protein